MSEIILASASLSRRQLLENAGISVHIKPSFMDESVIKNQYNTAADIAENLAQAKAKAVSASSPGAFVIGADQILTCEGQFFDKPTTLQEATARLKFLKGKTHILTGGVALVKDKELLWSYRQDSKMVMRNFSDSFLEDYIASEGEKLCTSVGAYLFEGRGIQLFSEIKGDYFAILGLPLLPLLQALRDYKVIAK